MKKRFKPPNSKQAAAASGKKSNDGSVHRQYSNMNQTSDMKNNSQNTSGVGLLNSKLDESQLTDSLVNEVYGNDPDFIKQHIGYNNQDDGGSFTEDGPVFNTLKQ